MIVKSFLFLLPLLSTSFSSTPEPTQSTQVASDFASMLPEKTIFYFSIPDLQRLEKKSKNLPWAKMLAEEEVKTFFEKPIAYTKEKGYPALWRTLTKELHSSTDASFLGDIHIQGIDFGFTRLQTGKDANDVQMGFCASLRFVESVDKLNAFVKELVAASPAGSKIAEVKIGALSGYSFEEPFTRMKLTWFGSGNQFVISVGINCEEPTITRLQSEKPGASLAQEKDFQASMSRVGGNDSELRFYGKLSEIYQILTSAMSMVSGDGEGAQVAMAGKFLSGLGLQEIRGVSFGSVPQDSYTLNQMFIPLSGRKGIMSVISSAPADLSLLKKVPKDAASFTVGALKVGALWELGHSSFKAASEEEYKRAMDQLAQFETQSGIKLKEELIDTFGEKAIFYSMPMQSLLASTPEVYFLVELKDRNRCEKSLALLLKILSERSNMFQLKENEFDGGKIYTVSNPQAPGTNPTFGFTDQFIVFGLSKTGVKKTLKRLGSAEGNGVLDLPDFAKYMGQIPKDACMVDYSDMRPMMTMLYQTLQAFAPMASSQLKNFPVDLAAMPSANAITKNFFGAVGYTTLNDSGLYYKSFSPFGADTLAGFGSFFLGCAADAAAIQEEVMKAYSEDLEKSMVQVKPSQNAKENPNAGADALVTEAKTTLLDMKAGITSYKLDNGKLPAALQDLTKATNEAPQGYIMTKTIPMDPWNHAYVYVLDASGKSYKLRSMGPNGQDEDGKGDDIVGN